MSFKEFFRMKGNSVGVVHYEWRTKSDSDGKLLQGFLIFEKRIVATIWPTSKGIRWLCWSRTGTIETEGVEETREDAEKFAADAAFDGSTFPGGYPMTQADLSLVMECNSGGDEVKEQVEVPLPIKSLEDSPHGSWGSVKEIEIDAAAYANALASALPPMSFQVPPWEFVPSEDITAYELARALPYLLHTIAYAAIDELPDHCRRHWKRRTQNANPSDPGDAGVELRTGDAAIGDAGEGDQPDDPASS